MLSLRLLRWPTLAQPAWLSLTARGGIDRGSQTTARFLLRLTSSYATASKAATGGVVFKLTKVDGSVNEEHAAKETTATELAPEPGLNLTPAGSSLCLLVSFFFRFFCFFSVFFSFFFSFFLFCFVLCVPQSS